MSGALPQLNTADFEPQIIWLLVVFSVLYYVIKNHITPYFSVEIENREQFIVKNHQEAKQLQKKAERLSDDYHEKIQAIHAKANHLILEAQQKFNSDLDIEKKKINTQTSQSLAEHCQVIDAQVQKIDQDFVSYLDTLKQAAQTKIFTNQKLSTRAS